ncbi:protein of unknown function [Modestobacter italicus]|uniref:Uncharacterized protein n=1 Tax=Modestobacter italicus (strain DSM 44449 / CECT 9708 / BC 501) TaxID=2732864 RepID=I4F0P3_MODI5|nr:protein of unknown function [Modestobacter marinus]
MTHTPVRPSSLAQQDRSHRGKSDSLREPGATAKWSSAVSVPAALRPENGQVSVRPLTGGCGLPFRNHFLVTQSDTADFR